MSRSRSMPISSLGLMAVTLVALLAGSALWGEVAHAQAVRCLKCGGRGRCPPGGLGRCKKWTNVNGQIVPVGSAQALAPAQPRPNPAPAPKAAPIPPDHSAMTPPAGAVNASVSPAKVEIAVWPRQWKPWDDGFAARAKDDRFRAAHTVPRESLPTKDFVPLCARIPQLEAAVQKAGDVAPYEREALLKLLEQTDETFYPDRAAQGNQPAVNAKLIERLRSDTLTRAEAEEFYSQALRVHQLKLHLGRTKNIPDDTRAKLAEEYDYLNAVMHQ